jgi:hypothetical protein
MHNVQAVIAHDKASVLQQAVLEHVVGRQAAPALLGKFVKKLV